MGSKRTDIKRLSAAIKPYGLTIQAARKHRQILNAQGKIVWHMSSTPSCPFYAVNTLHDLKKLSLVSKEAHL